MKRKIVIGVLFVLLALSNIQCEQTEETVENSEAGSSTESTASRLKSQLAESLSLASYGPDFVELAFDEKKCTVSPNNIKAYIGVNGSITANGAQVINALSGPVALSGTPLRFGGLSKDESYRVILVADTNQGPVSAYYNPIRAACTEIDPGDYLVMSDEELGLLKWALKIADDDLDDFSRIPSLNTMGLPPTGYMNLFFCSYRYSIAFYTYYLATVQYHKIPACQDIIQPRMDRLIQKMLEKRVWEYWAQTSTGYFTFPFGTLELGQIFYESEHDPVRIKNIMYSGHLAQMLALYEKLYHDMKWSEPGSIVFEWNRREKYVYDCNTLHKLIRDMFLNLPDHCIECEPNLCFPECNQHPILALRVYDEVHGTTYYNDVKETHMDWYLEHNLIDPVTHDTAAIYLPLNDVTLGPDQWDVGNYLSLITLPLTDYLNFRLAFAAADGWTMSFMHAWQPEYIAHHYAYNKLNRIDSETGQLKMDTIGSDERGAIDMIADQLGVPFYAILAGEMGDAETRDNIIRQCNTLYSPTWNDDGTYCYPVGPIDTIVKISDRYFANSTTGALAGIAMANPANGLLQLHSEPFPGDRGPVVKNVDLDKVSLKRAVYDAAKDALVVSTERGTFAKDQETCSLTIGRMDPARTWHLNIDGRETGVYKGVSSIPVELSADRPHSLVLAAE